jgi:hypothetical protein
MKTILIDTENISKREEYELIAELKRCKLIFFETKNTKNNQIPLSTAMKLSQSKVKIEFLHVDVTGKNALDFKICALAGKVNKWNSEVYILSRDKGYDNLKEFNIHRIESIKNLNCHCSRKSELLASKLKALTINRMKKRPLNIENVIENKVKYTVASICNKYENDMDFINNLINGINKQDLVLINDILNKKFRNSNRIAQKQLYKSLVNTCM